MVYLAPFILGFIAGSLVQWQRGRRKQHPVAVAPTAPANVVAVREPQPAAAAKEKAAEPSPGAAPSTGQPAPTGNKASTVAELVEDADAAEKLNPQELHNAALDDLTVIRGIGPVYAKRLNAAGILSFAQLAELTPEQITDLVVQGNIDKVIDIQDWIAQAQQLAAHD